MMFRAITKKNAKRGRFLAERFLLFVTLGYVLSLVVGYKPVIAGNTPPEVELRQTMIVLERGESALASSSVDYRQALTSVIEALPPGTEGFVRSDITIFLKRAPDRGADFECGPEFMRFRARQELERVQNKLLNTVLLSASPEPAEPQFCYAVPFAIDLSQPIKTLEIYGYDLDTQPLELYLVNDDGSFHDVSSTLSRRTHYHLTVDLGQNGVKLSPQSQMLSIAWGHIIRYSVSLIQPTTPLCQSHIEEIPAGKTITISSLRISGSGSLGRGRNVRASAMLNYESNKVDATVCVMAIDQESDPTTFGGCAVEYVYTIDPERVIEGVFMGLESRTSRIHLHPGQNVMEGSRDRPVSRWEFVLPNAESRATVEPMVTVVLRKIRIASTKIDNCLPVVAYLEARRKSAIAPGTLKRLDSQSKTLEREILKLRPRFEPRPN